MKDYRMTVHWEHSPSLLELTHDIILEKSLYIFDRNRITCAGGTAPIDMVLAIISKQQGAKFAHLVSDWFLHNEIRPSGGPQRSNLVNRVGTTNKIPLKITKDQKAKALKAFYAELKKAMINLAKKIVLDGEGAKKFIEITVTNAKTTTSAKKICFSIANSLLVKTAIAGEDANWGRLIMAIGKTKINLKIENIKIFIQNFLLCENGKAINAIDDTKLSLALKRKTVNIKVDLGEGSREFTVWTSDLTEDYVRINADYRS